MLACGQPIAYVESLFGPPALRREHDGALTESVFYTPQALVQILADEVVGTRRWSITVIDDRFAFRVRALTFGLTDVRLGKSRFWNLTHDETGHVIALGDGRRNYVEAHDFGNAGAMQVYLFGFNQAGVGDFDDAALRDVGLVSLIDGAFAAQESQLEPRAVAGLRSFRSATTINTLTVTEAFAEPALTTLLPFGVDFDHVRVFRPATARRQRDGRRATASE